MTVEEICEYFIDEINKRDSRISIQAKQITQLKSDIEKLTNEKWDEVNKDEKINTFGKLKEFMQVFNELNGAGDVKETEFIGHLLIHKFSKDEAIAYIKEAMKNGMIYERKIGVYAKA